MRFEDQDQGAEPAILYTPPTPLAVWHRAIVWGIFLLALLVRAAYLKQLQASELWGELPADAGYYHDWAVKIATGEWVPAVAFPRSPLYAWFLAGVFRLFGPGLMAPRLFQAAIGAATCVLVYRIGRQAFSPAAGLAAGLTACVYGPWLFQDGAIGPDVLAVLLAAAALYQIFAANGSQRGLLASSGLCLGLAALARDTMILAAPAVVSWLILDPWLRGGRSAGRVKESAGRVAAFAIGLALVLAPVTARNYHASGEMVLLTTGAGGAGSIGDYPKYREAVPILRVTGPLWLLLAPVAASGLALSLTRWRETLCLYLILGGYAVPALFGIRGLPGTSLIPIALVFAGSGLVETTRALLERKWARLALAVAAALGAFLLAPAGP